MNGPEKTIGDRRALTVNQMRNLAEAIELFWEKLDERGVGVGDYQKLRHDGLGLLTFTAHAGPVVLGLREMARTLQPQKVVATDNTDTTPHPTDPEPGDDVENQSLIRQRFQAAQDGPDQP